MLAACSFDRFRICEVIVLHFDVWGKLRRTLSEHFLSPFNTVPPRSLKYNSQQLLNRCNRGLVLDTNWSKGLIMIEDSRD